jgi:predicted ATP-grasp superfamily ATP-dependent carboligase
VQSALVGAPDDEQVVAQEHIRGHLMAVSLVVGRDVRAVASFQQRAHRTWPPGAGPSSLAVSVALDSGLAERAAGLLSAAGYWGLAELQFIDDARKPALIDINTRFYGSLALALASGVNLPAMWHAVALGQDPAVNDGYRIGVRYRWLEGEFIAAIHGRPGLLLHRTARPRVGPMWAADDPLAGAVMGAGIVGGWLRRRIPVSSRGA